VARLLINPNPWFNYNSNILFPNGDIFINIMFRGRGEWVGEGNTGQTIGTKAFIKENNIRRKNW